MESKRLPEWNQVLWLIKLRNTESLINWKAVIRRRYCGKQLGLCNTKLALLQIRFEMGGYVTDQCHMTDRQHQCQNDNPHTYRLVHSFILKQLFTVDAPGIYFDLKCHTSRPGEWL
jgi:hypothetical protein